MSRSNRPRGAPENPVRSVRVDNATWEKAARRATYESVTMSEVLLAFVRGYGEGLINMPRVQVVYTGVGNTGAPAPAPTAEAG